MIYGLKHGKYWFSHIFYSSFAPLDSTKIKLQFSSFLEQSNQIHWIFCKKSLSFFRKYTNSSKIRSRGAVHTQSNLYSICYPDFVFVLMIKRKNHVNLEDEAGNRAMRFPSADNNSRVVTHSLRHTNKLGVLWNRSRIN